MPDRAEIERIKELPETKAMAQAIQELITPKVNSQVWKSTAVCAVLVGAGVYCLSRVDVQNLRHEVEALRQIPILNANHNNHTINVQPSEVSERDKAIHAILKKRNEVD